MKILIEVADLEPGRTKSHMIARYVRAALKVQSLRREFGQALIEMRACKKVLCDRTQANSLLAEAEVLCEELHIEPANR